MMIMGAPDLCIVNETERERRGAECRERQRMVGLKLVVA